MMTIIFCNILNVLHPLFQVRELGREPGSPTAAHPTHVPPFQYEITNLKAMTWYNMSVSCTNEIGSSPPSAWVQSNTTEGGESVHIPGATSCAFVNKTTIQCLNVFEVHFFCIYVFKNTVKNSNIFTI